MKQIQRIIHTIAKNPRTPATPFEFSKGGAWVFVFFAMRKRYYRVNYSGRYTISVCILLTVPLLAPSALGKTRDLLPSINPK